MLDPFLPENPEHIAHLKSLQEEVHAGFKDVVTTARGDKLQDPETNEIFSGKFWAGKTALSLGLIDGITSLHDKMTDLYGDNFKLIPIRSDKRGIIEKYIGMHAETAVSELSYTIQNFITPKLR